MRLSRPDSRFPAATFAVTVLAAIALFPGALPSQMVTGKDMEDFAKTFGIRGDGPSVRQIASTPGANVLWPGDEATFAFHVDPGAPYKGPLKFDVIRYGTRGKPGDMWRPVVFKIGDVGSTTIDVDLPRGGGEVVVAPRIGEGFGGYALVVDLEGRRAFGCACVRVPAAQPGREQIPTYALDLPWPHEMSRAVYTLFKRLGVKGARVEGGYDTIGAAHVDWAMEDDLTLMLTVGCGNTPRKAQPLGRGRPWLRPTGEMIEGIKEDLAWMPSFDDEFERYLTGVLREHGWPKGPINAVELWNEPWEGVSISGWGADMLRYREIYTRMARAVLRAREEAGVRVLMGGASSSTNTRDKLFPDGTDAFLPWLDFVSIHYQPLAADPALVPEWMEREGEYGPVRVWDTESWVANSEDRVAAVIASMRAMGQDRTAGIYRGNVYTPEKHRIGGREHAVVQAWSPAAAVAACQRFIGQRAFREILWKNGLPWVFVFDGLPGRTRSLRGGVESGVQSAGVQSAGVQSAGVQSAGVQSNGVQSDGVEDDVADASRDDGTLVIVGDLGASYDRNRVLFRSVGIADGASLKIPDGGGRFVLFDFYANPLPSQDGKIIVPIDGRGYFLRSDGRPGSFAALIEAVREGRIEGVAPVEIVARDPTAPIASRPRVGIRLTNMLNRSLEGTIAVRVDGLAIEPAWEPVAIAGNESRDFAFTVAGGAASPDNRYRLEASFDAGPDGCVLHREVLHVNFVPKRRIDVDGDLGEWEGIFAQKDAATVRASATEKAWLPFKEWREAEGGGGVEAYFAHDDDFFYFAARVPRMEGTVRFETRDDDAYFYPETVTSRGKELRWPEGVRRYSYRKDPDLPSGNGKHNVQIAFNAIPPEGKPWRTHPRGTMPGFCAYLDTDYEYALNLVADEHGGGTEIFCLARPGAPRKHFYPRQPRAPTDGGPVKGDARLAVRAEVGRAADGRMGAGGGSPGRGHIVECRIPWTEMPEVKRRIDAGGTVKLSFRVNDGGRAFELAAGRSASKDNPFAFHDDWSTHWANEIEFGFER